MEVGDQIVNSLMRLGLTRYEALAYIALVHLGSSTVTEISKLSGVPTTKLYDVLRKLAARGWVELLQGRPMMFRARPPKEVLRAELNKLTRDVRDAESVLSEIYKKRTGVERPEVWMVRGQASVENKVMDMLENARTRISTVFSKLALDLLDKVKGCLKDAYWRGLEVRVLLTGVEEGLDLGGPEVVVLRRKPFGVETTIIHSLVVVDALELMLVLPVGVREETIRDVVGVWVRDPSLAQLTDDYVTYVARVARGISA